MSARDKNTGNLRIEIWMNDNLEWSLQGDGSAEQYRQAHIKVASLFPDEQELRLVVNRDDVRNVNRPDAVEQVKNLGGSKNVMLCDPAYERMMAFIYE